MDMEDIPARMSEGLAIVTNEAPKEGAQSLSA